MNIFYLDSDPKIAAQMHCDKHCVKMITEYAQLLSTAHRILDGTEYIERTANNRSIKRWKLTDKEMDSTLYRSTHANHPSAVWARQSTQNYEFLYELYTELAKEYTKRYHKNHRAYELPKDLLKNPPMKCEDDEFTEPPPAMPEHCKVSNDSVTSYRNYYLMEKTSFARWKFTKEPLWYTIGLQEQRKASSAQRTKNHILGIHKQNNFSISGI